MSNLNQVTSAVLLSMFLMLSMGQVSADWEIEPLNETYIQTPVSNESKSVRIVNLSGDVDQESGDEGINKTKLNGNNKNLNYLYNASDSRNSFTWMYRGYYYTEFYPNTSVGDHFKYELRKDDGTVEKEWTDRLSFGNMTVENLQDYSSKVEPDKSFDIKVNVTDDWNDTFEDEADVDLYLTNISWTSDIYDIDNSLDENGDSNQDGYKNFGLNFNLAHNSTYVMHFNATNSSGVGYNNSSGSTSLILETLPSLESEIAYLNTSSSGCNNQSFFTECERDVELETGLNVTAAQANGVNLTVRLENQSGGMVENQTIEMSESNGAWRANFSVPDINTSKHKKKFQLLYNASSDNQNDITKYNITYRSYTITDKSASKTTPGDYQVRIEFSKYFSPIPLDSSKFKNATVNITDPDNEELTSFNLSDMSYDGSEGLFENSINIPLDSTEGSYTTDIVAYNIFEEMKSIESGFTLSDVDQTFNITEDRIDREINKTGVTEVNITVENLLSAERNLTAEFQNETENITSIGDDDKIELNSSQKKNVTIDFNISYVDGYEGDIKFMDSESNYNQSIEVDISAPSCDNRNEEVCVNEDGLNVSSDQEGFETEEMDVIYLGDRSSEKFMTTEITGNVSDYLTVDPSNITVNETHDMETVDLNYSVEEDGFFEGRIETGTSDHQVNLSVSLDSNLTTNSGNQGQQDQENETEISFTVTESVDLGTVEEGGSTSADVDIENTGDVAINSLEFSSDSFSVDADSTSVAAGSTETVTIDFSSVESSSGTVTVTASTDSGEAEQEISVSAETVADYVEKANSLESRLTGLDRQVSDSSLQQQLNNAQARITEIKTAHREGNYDKAKTVYNEVSSTVDSIERQSRSSTGGTAPDQSEDGGGSGILVPLAAGVLVFLLIGFVAYTSIIPEEGDPLYNVLGE